MVQVQVLEVRGTIRVLAVLVPLPLAYLLLGTSRIWDIGVQEVQERYGVLYEDIRKCTTGTRGTTKIPNVPLSYVLYMRYAKVHLGEHARGYRYKYESAPLAYPPLCTHYVRKGTLRGTQGVHSRTSMSVHPLRKSSVPLILLLYPVPRGTQGMQVQVQDRTPCIPPVYPLHTQCVPLSVCVSRVQGVRKGYTRGFYTFVVPVVHFFTSSYCTPYLLYMYLMYP